jgi:membrane fusion protein, multidrug efflux system
MKRWLLLIVAIVALVVVVGAVKGVVTYKEIQGFKAQGEPKFSVSSIKAGYDDWQSQLAAVGSLRAERGADLSAEVAGIVDGIDFHSGDDVKAGQVLLRLRAADDVAHLESLKATAALAEITYNRDKAQLAAEAVSQAVVDNDAATLKSAKAQVAEQQALVNKKTVYAPFGGHLGIRAVDLGQYLAAGTKIVTLQQLDPIFVDFSVPQQALSQVGVGQKVQATLDAFPGKTFAGEISAIDPQVDADTRNVQVRATVPNPDHKLLPGMYATVNVTVGAQQQRYITLPQTAIAYNPYGATAYLVIKRSQDKDAKPAAAGQPQGSPDDLIAKQVFVVTGPTRGDQVAILKGISEGDEVVTSGQIKLRNGVPVTIDNSVLPTNDPNPHPQEQ